jgi:hypothetical protein
MKNLMIVFTLLAFVGCNDPAPKPVPAPTPSASASPGPSPTPSPVPSPSPSPTPSPSPSPSPTPPPSDVDALFNATDSVRAQVRGYVQSFIDDGAKVGVDAVQMMKQSPKLEMRIASLSAWGANVIGLCETGSGYRRVTFDPGYFNASQTDLNKRILSHHELGHCILFRPHRTDVGLIPDNSGHTHEMSVMYPVMIGSAQYVFHEPYYLEELFQQLDVSSEPRVWVCPSR